MTRTTRRALCQSPWRGLIPPKAAHFQSNKKGWCGSNRRPGFHTDQQLLQSHAHLMGGMEHGWCIPGTASHSHGSRWECHKHPEVLQSYQAVPYTTVEASRCLRRVPNMWCFLPSPRNLKIIISTRALLKHPRWGRRGGYLSRSKHPLTQKNHLVTMPH